MSDKGTSVPWGRLAALMTACLVTLIGVLCGLEPFLVLQRAAGGGAVVGIAVAVAVRMCALVT